VDYEAIAAKAKKEADAKVAAAQAESKRLAAEIETQRQAEAKRREQAEKERIETEAKRKKAEEETMRLTAEVEKARLAAASQKSDVAQKAQMEAEAKRKAAEDESKRLMAQIEALKLAEAKRAADADKNRMSSDAKKKAADEEAKRLEMLAREEQLRQMALAAERKKEEEAAKKLAEEKIRQQEAEAKARADAAIRARLVPGKPWVNSMGMRFVPVGDVLVCVWECRVGDFDTFVTATRYDATSQWKSPGFTQTPSHPAINVSWQDAQAFCKWLTEKETKAGLFSGFSYRLPTDVEWSKMAGLDSESGATPSERDGRSKGVYPWGTAWPPPVGSGNYSERVTFDAFEETAPVASFRPNKFGIYDVGGNAWEWCMDTGDTSQQNRVLRGGSWFGYSAGSLLTSYRRYAPANDRHNDQGFRVVIAK
ncbi:MAG TPA: SUMF1/EgtB/PvdO family nonheme iron enzyme, partial [Roseimicrobium sp.]|nr:SUMF1/EgtB/PvdO family nonheme iron enzyme [Roseimicrobium sp.]